MVVILNMKLLNLEEIIDLYQLKSTVFMKSVNYLTVKDYKQHYLEFIRKEKRRTNIMT